MNDISLVTQPSDESLKLDMTVNELKIKENAIHASGEFLTAGKVHTKP